MRVHLLQQVADVLVHVALPAQVRAFHHLQLLPVKKLRVLCLLTALTHSGESSYDLLQQSVYYVICSSLEHKCQITIVKFTINLLGL